MRFGILYYSIRIRLSQAVTDKNSRHYGMIAKAVTPRSIIAKKSNIILYYVQKELKKRIHMIAAPTSLFTLLMRT